MLQRNSASLTQIRAVIVLFLVLACFGGCSEPASVPESEITFLYTSNTRAYTEPCGCCSKQTGGLPIRAHYIGGQRVLASGGTKDKGAAAGQAANLLVLDAGGFSDNTSDLKQIQSVYTAQAMELMAYDVVNLGRNETMLGQELLSKVLQGFKSTQVVSANFSFSQPKQGQDFSQSLGLNVKPFVRLQVGDYSVFITGVTSATPVHHNTAGSSGMDVGPIAESLAQIFGQARSGELIVILVNSLGASEKAEVETALDSLLESKNCVGVIVGHGEIKDNKPFPMIGSLDTDVPYLTLVNGLDRGRGVTRAVVTTSADGTVSKKTAGFEKLKKSLPKDNKLLELMYEMAEEAAENDRRLHAKLAGGPGQENYKYIGGRVCRRCHMDQFKDHLQSGHYKAYETLRHEGERNNAMCLPCHTVGYGQSGGYLLGINENPALRGVGCESCHGAGTYHRLLQYSQTKGEPPEGANEQGFSKVTEQTCLKCHTDETDLEWDYEQKLPLVDHSGGD